MRNRTAFLILSFLSISGCFTISSTAQTTAQPQHEIAANGLQLRDGWALQSSCKVEKKGEVISTSRFTPTGWYAVSVPTTVVAALVKHKVYPDPMFGINLRPVRKSFSRLTHDIAPRYLAAEKHTAAAIIICAVILTITSLMNGVI